VDDLDDAIGLVYAQEPTGFVTARNTLVKELKAAKRKEDAAQVAALRRPTKLAWAMGAAVRSEPSAAASFQDAVAALAASGADIRARTADLRKAVQALSAAAAVHGVDAGDAEAGFLAVAADPEAATALRQGRLADVPAAGGFGLSPMPAPHAARADERHRAAGDGGDERAAEAEAEAEAERRAEEAAARRRGLEADVRAATERREAAEEAARAAREALARAEGALQQARAAEDEATAALQHAG
jgi:hypothetical protein